ncbi:signal peptidase I [candidate division WWE3 bacterium]|nr:signal peptidase I [candidate division WWE3 bacterium]
MAKILKRFIINSLQITLILAAVIAVTNFFLGELLIVTGSSMYPTLKDQEQIIGEKVSLDFEPPQRNEIVIAKNHNKGILVIKRVIGLPGETIKIQEGNVYINNEKLAEPYTKGQKTKAGQALEEGKSYEIPENSYVLLGDNRKESIDSRKWGFMPLEDITSRAILVYYPVKNFRFIKD